MRLDQIVTGSHPRLHDQSNNQVRMSERSEGNKGYSSQQNQTEEVIGKQLETAISKLNNFIEPLRTDLRFKYHEKLNEYYVTVVNPLTDEIIKEIPPKKMLDMYAEMAEFMGILIDEKI
ncbi:flagellar protein FlaG [Agaribacter marinus]|uniref:Flagellar protein FlaG n=2 Tax=Bacillaceae TaxID=186817 RepID=A0A941DW55_9BACI|nr:flagellar protein FlaG [Virgibacillus salarius]NAZ10595.1 flagellar protein FlaG [Agaribacter marinus]QRZ20278.1 flagellar protein FlaG [Virgibacillus sp. AGTR]